MDYLQYILLINFIFYLIFYFCFKPYYKWITFNTINNHFLQLILQEVLNLIINGLPSIPYEIAMFESLDEFRVLNLIINGLPSILFIGIHFKRINRLVLNLIINGLPSIHIGIILVESSSSM